MLTPEERKLLEFLIDPRLIDPDAEDSGSQLLKCHVVRRLLEEHDALLEEVKNVHA